MFKLRFSLANFTLWISALYEVDILLKSFDSIPWEKLEKAEVFKLINLLTFGL